EIAGRAFAGGCNLTYSRAQQKAPPPGGRGSRPGEATIRAPTTRRLQRCLSCTTKRTDRPTRAADQSQGHTPAAGGKGRRRPADQSADRRPARHRLQTHLPAGLGRLRVEEARLEI